MNHTIRMLIGCLVPLALLFLLPLFGAGSGTPEGEIVRKIGIGTAKILACPRRSTPRLDSCADAITSQFIL